MTKRWTSVFISLLTLAGLTACTAATNPPSDASSSPKPSPTEQGKTDNILGLFLVKKDNTTNQFRGELLPIALYLNGKYVDISQDVTPEMRDGYALENLIRNQESKSFLKVFNQFKVIDQSKEQGQFTVDKLGVTQLACSAFLVGQGTFAGDRALETLYNSLSEQRSGGYSGKLGNQTVDEAWRWTFAVNQYTPPASPPANTDNAAYQKDLLAAATPLLAAAQEAQAVTGETTVEKVQVFDLDRDGKPEVFGTLRKGKDPKAVPPADRGRSQTTAYINVWLTYKTEQPTVLSSEVTAWQIPVSRSPYEVLETLDINGDGIDEVIVRDVGYESYSFGVHELQNGKLVPVFKGAAYGC